MALTASSTSRAVRPDGEGASYQGAHARPDDAVDGDAQFLERGEHADVGRALGAAAAEHQSDARPMIGAVAAPTPAGCDAPASAAATRVAASSIAAVSDQVLAARISSDAAWRVLMPPMLSEPVRGRDDRRALSGPFTASAPAA